MRTTARAMPTSRDQGRRLRWADVARGACVLLVVTHHFVTKSFDLTLPERLDWAENVWLAFTSALKPLRMPLFFTLSGFFAARAVERPWRDVLGPRVGGPYYLYALWLCIHAVIFSYATTLPMNRTRSFEELAFDLVYASTSMWYLYALPVYFLLLKVLHRSRLLLFIVAFVLATVAMVAPLEAVNRVSVLANFVYFAAGATYPDVLRRVADSSRKNLNLALAGAYVLFGGLLLGLEAPRALTILVVSGVAVPLALRGAVLVSRWRSGGSVVAWVGRRTLPVYVLHVPFIALMHHLPNPLRWATWPTTQPVLGNVISTVYPVVATIVVAALCLLVHAVLIRCGLGWLFQRPRGATVR